MGRFFMGVLFLSLLTACGSDKSSAYQPGSNKCSQSFVNEYTDLSRKVSNVIKTRGDRKGVRDQVVQFKSKYSGVKCQAQVYDINTMRNYGVQMIDVDQQMDQIITVLDSGRSQRR